MKNGPWNLYLDDIRHPADTTYIVAQTVEEVQQLIEQYGVSEHISFDHDLGMGDAGEILPSGYDFTKWLVEMDMEGIAMIPRGFEFKVHSQNPVGAKTSLNTSVTIWISNQKIKTSL